MKYPLVSIVVATYNSEDTLGRLLESVRKQSYPQDKIELLVIDGGSGDETLEIARKFGCRLLKNLKVDQVYAKYAGWKKARGKYILFLDSDEAFVKKSSIKNKVLALQNDKSKRVVQSSGYAVSPVGFFLNDYINEFGDPFSFFMYRISKSEKCFMRDFNRLSIPFVELTSMGVMIDRKFVKSNFPEVFKNTYIHTHLYYLITKLSRPFVILKNDPIFHRSVTTLKAYLKKIRSRIKNNIYATSMGLAGFSGREDFQPAWYRVKKFLFIPYTLLILPVFLDSIYLTVTRRNLSYFWHMPLCFYTLSAIVYYYLLKAFGVEVKLVGYGT